MKVAVPLHAPLQKVFPDGTCVKCGAKIGEPPVTTDTKVGWMVLQDPTGM